MSENRTTLPLCTAWLVARGRGREGSGYPIRTRSQVLASAEHIISKILGYTGKGSLHK